MIHGNAELYNVEELLEDGPGPAMTLTRLPNDLRRQLNESARQYALQTAGCEIRFNLGRGAAKICLQSLEGPAIVEVHHGCFFGGWHVVGAELTEITVESPPALEVLAELTRGRNLPFDARLTRVVLPWNATTKLLSIAGDVSLPRPEQAPERKLLAYGSSITQGYSAICPSDSYAQRSAQLLGVDLINLGLAGGAQLEPAIAEYIAGRSDWNFAILEMGINLIRGVETDEFERRVRTFVPLIGHRHVDKWIFCIDLFTCGIDFAGDPKIGAFREVVRRTVSDLGMPRLIYLSGAELLTSAHGLTPDLIHLAPLGMEEVAQNLVRRIGDKIGTGSTEAYSKHV